MRIRPLTQSDLSEVLLIESAVHIAPWPRDTFLTCLDAGCLGWIAEVDHQCAGFILVNMAIQECHVLNVAVKRAFQRQGIGRQLMKFVIDQAEHHAVRMIYLEVRRSNEAAIKLYEQLAFQMIGERKKYYPITQDEYEDALIFARLLNQKGE